MATYTSSVPRLDWFVKPKTTETVTRETETSNQSGGGNIPQAAVGIPVCSVIGRKRVPDANTLWTGNLRPLTQVTTSTTSEKEVVNGQTVNTTKTVTTTAIIGYLVDIHMGICLGPGVSLIGIYVDNQRIWSGNVGPARSTFTIDENLTFLSKASCVFSGGAFDQAPEPDISVVDYPGYVGIATILLKGVRADLPMGNLSFEVVRVPNPLSLSGTINRVGDDVNLATAIVEVMTNEWGYGGLDIADIDTAKFTSMATTLKDEGNICSIKIGSEASIASILKALQDQGDMIIFQNPETGKITGELVRTSNIVYSDMTKRFGVNNIIELRSFQKSGWKDTIEQARGLYTERDNDYNEVPVFAQNGANPSQSGRGKKTTSFYYPYSPNKTLTLDLTSRDLALFAAPVYNFSLLTNRDGASLVPGNIIIVTWPLYSLLNVPMLVMSVRKQEMNYNTVSLTLRQLDLPDNTSTFGPGGTAYDPNFDLKPKKPLAVAFKTSPYFIARAAFGITGLQVTPQIYSVVLPKPANDFQFSFGALLTNQPDTTGDVVKIVNGLYPTYAKLNGAIDLYDSFATGSLSTVNIDGVINPINLIDVGNAGVRQGRLLVMIDNEIMSFESVTDNGGGSYTLNNVKRALLDTVFESHADNADVYIIGNNYNFVAGGFNYPLGYTPSWVITSNSLTEKGIKADGLTSTGWSASANRTLSPPRPHNTKVNGAARSSSATTVTEGASTTVTWATRSRLRGDVALMTDSADAAEGDQKHRVYHRSSGGTLTDLSGLVSGNTATFTMPDVANGAGTIFVQAEVTLGGNVFTSIFQDRIPVNVV
jgi:hypothetical protein